MTSQNSICPYFRINCEDKTRKYDEELCLGTNGNFRNCGTYKDIIKMQEQVANKTHEKGRSIVAMLT
ncbi:hypothetical protein HY449_04235 [Candidatus Pacearchaeota archaeon]|nr:hypothetical protein [Candidatus Pacearchaeota archaeon]